MNLKALSTLLITAESYDPAPVPQRPLIDSRQFAMLLFIVTEVMFFAFAGQCLPDHPLRA